jgi:hypothetical protein
MAVVLGACAALGAALGYLAGPGQPSREQAEPAALVQARPEPPTPVPAAPEPPSPEPPKAKAPERPSPEAPKAEAPPALPLTPAPAKVTPALTAEQFEQVHRLIKPQPGEWKFADVPWAKNVWEARQRAAKEGKPLLIWQMAGEPLGQC